MCTCTCNYDKFLQNEAVPAQNESFDDVVAWQAKHILHVFNNRACCYDLLHYIEVLQYHIQNMRQAHYHT